MPFSMAERLLKCVTLQVRIPLRSRGKKVLLSLSGSLTLEAALTIALLIFSAVSLMLPMRIMDTERKMQAALERVGEDFSKYAYLQETWLPGLAEGYVQAEIMEHADTSMIQQITMNRSEIFLDGEWFDLVYDYEIRMPFPVLGLDALHRTVRCRRRAWIGKEGKGCADGSETENGEEMVYVGKYSTRYHRDRYCHYLSNNLTGVPFDKVGEMRNQDGGKYHACAVCAAGCGSGSTVYIMPSGKSYHGSRTCSAIVAYVRMVPLSEAAHLGACSYCGGQ